jgi:hypothetical protein
MTYSHENTPIGFRPCTREAGHEGPCALEEMTKDSCPDCTDWQMAYGRGGSYKKKWLFGIYGFIPFGKEWVVCETCGGTGQVYE